jgi:hypothetical protein
MPSKATVPVYHAQTISHGLQHPGEKQKPSDWTLGKHMKLESTPLTPQMPQDLRTQSKLRNNKHASELAQASPVLRLLVVGAFEPAGCTFVPLAAALMGTFFFESRAKVSAIFLASGSVR